MLAVIQDDAESLALFREAMKGESGRPSTEESHNNVMELKSVHGTSKSYTVSRLKRDRPDLFERVVAGEFHNGQLIELPNLRSLITEKPIRGWGQNPDKIQAVIQDDAEALALFREAMKGEEGGDKKSHAKITNNNIIGDDCWRRQAVRKQKH
jgi:hypothetical protein